MVVVAGHLLQRAVAYGLMQTVGQILPVAVGQFGERHGVSRALVGQREIAEFGDVALVVAYHHRNGIVGGYDVEQELHVGIDINLGKTFSGFGPDVHTLTLLYSQLLDQRIGNQHKPYDRGHRYRHHQELTEASVHVNSR